MDTDVRHHRVTVLGVDTFYREAGPEDAPVVVQRHQRLPNLPQHHAGRRVHVHDRANIRPGGVDARVNPELGVRLPFALNPVAIDIEHQ